MRYAPQLRACSLEPESPGLLVAGGYHHDIALHLRRDQRTVLRDEHIYLRAHPEIGQVDPRLQRNGDARDNRAGIVGLPSVQVDGVAMDLAPQAVAQPVVEVASVARSVDLVPGDLV